MSFTKTVTAYDISVKGTVEMNNSKLLAKELKERAKKVASKCEKLNKIKILPGMWVYLSDEKVAAYQMIAKENNMDLISVLKRKYDTRYDHNKEAEQIRQIIAGELKRAGLVLDDLRTVNIPRLKKYEAVMDVIVDIHDLLKDQLSNNKIAEYLNIPVSKLTKALS